MARMIKTKFGYTSAVETRCLGNLEHELKTDKRWKERIKHEKKLSDKEKAKLWDDLPKYITVSQPDGELISYIPLKPEVGLTDGMIVNKGFIFTENYSDEDARFADVNGKIYYEGAMTWGNHRDAQNSIDSESND